MRSAVTAAVSALIDAHQLHARGVPVDLSELELIFVPSRAPLYATGVLGLAMPPLRGGRATIERPAGIVLDEQLDGADRRLVYAHEVGHILCGHAGSLAIATISRAWHDKQEREAWEVAAALLVPLSLFLDGETAHEVAMRCMVPVDLVERHPWL